jgi:hypothetical protein
MEPIYLLPDETFTITPIPTKAPASIAVLFTFSMVFSSLPRVKKKHCLLLFIYLNSIISTGMANVNHNLSVFQCFMELTIVVAFMGQQ